MSVWPHITPEPASLAGTEGELVSVRITVAPRLLEELLEELAGLPFPLNPQIHHHLGAQPEAVVEFPAYQANLDPVRRCLSSGGIPDARLEVRRMLDELSGT